MMVMMIMHRYVLSTSPFIVIIIMNKGDDDDSER